MADTEPSPQENGGSGWMGRAFGKVMGMFTPSASAQKMMDMLPEDADEDLVVRRQDRKRGREDSDSIKSNGKKDKGSSRGKRLTEEEALSSDDSDVEEASSPVPRKKARGRGGSDASDEPHRLQESVRTKDGRERTQKAVKKVAGSNLTSTSGSSASGLGSRTSSKKNITGSKSSPISKSAKGLETRKTFDSTKKSSSRTSNAPSSSHLDSDDSELDDEMDYLEEEEDDDSLEVSVEEEENIEIVWPTIAAKVELGISYYAWVEINGVRFSRGDSVYLRSGSKTPFIAKLVELKHDDKNGSTCSIAWWYRKGDIKGTPMEPKELIESTNIETNPLQSISTSRKPNILFGAEQKNKALAQQHADTFFYYRFYDTSTSKVQVL